MIGPNQSQTTISILVSLENSENRYFRWREKGVSIATIKTWRRDGRARFVGSGVRAGGGRADEAICLTIRSQPAGAAGVGLFGVLTALKLLILRMARRAKKAPLPFHCTFIVRKTFHLRTSGKPITTRISHNFLSTNLDPVLSARPRSATRTKQRIAVGQCLSRWRLYRWSH